MAVAGVQAHAIAVALNDQLIAVILDFVGTTRAEHAGDLALDGRRVAVGRQDAFRTLKPIRPQGVDDIAPDLFGGVRKIPRRFRPRAGGPGLTLPLNADRSFAWG